MLAGLMSAVRAGAPLVHCITNYVTANDCANLLLACGASPIMADDPDESAEITRAAAALVLNMGTPSPRRLEAMLRSGRAASEAGLPVVLDPVGVGSSSLRIDAARRLLAEAHISVIRGNASEIAALAEGRRGERGVDSAAQGSVALARSLARDTGAVVLLTGAEDIVTDGETTLAALGGHPMMRLITGAGCQLSALTGAFVAAAPARPLEAALAAACAMGLCGETAHARLHGPDGSAALRAYVIDAMSNLTPEALEEGARYEVR